MAATRALFGLLLAALTVALGAPAASAQAQAPFTVSGPSVVRATASDGTALSIPLQITDAELSPVSPPGSQVTAPPGWAFLVIDALTAEQMGSGPTFAGFDAVPTRAITLRTTSGAVPAVASGQSDNLVTGTYFFAVPASITSAQLVIGPATVSALEASSPAMSDAKFTQVTVSPSTVDLVRAPAPPASSTPNTTHPRAAAAKTSTATPTHRSGSSATVAAAAGGGGGLVVLLLVVPIWVRRRRYRKAEERGDVVVETPPDGTDDAEHAPDEPADHRVEVRLLGPLDVRGLKRAITGAPALELLVFLALHPGRHFTSVELRALVWAEPRHEPTSGSFRNYLVTLRRSLPQGTLECEGYRYRLTDSVTSDWAQFQAQLALTGGARLSHLRAALELVRGRPFTGIGARDPDAYAWAIDDLVPVMDRRVEEAVHELVGLALEAGDPELATWALGRWGPRLPPLLEDDAARVAQARQAPVTDP